MASSGFSASLPSIFTGENYDFWAAKMKAYLRAYDLWEITKTGSEPPALRANPTIAQLKQRSEEVAKKFKALSCIQYDVSNAIITRIIICETAKEAWDSLKEEFRGNARTRQMQVLNLRREYETLKMKDLESVNEYANRLLKVVNQIRLLGDDLPDRRIVEKVLISLPEKFEAKISSLEDSRDLSTITLSELVNALQATEQRCKQKWCLSTLCSLQKDRALSQMVLVQTINFKASSSVETWLLDSGCTHHMTSDASIFVELNDAYRSKVEVGNGEHVEVTGIGVISVQTPSGTKLISNVLFVPPV